MSEIEKNKLIDEAKGLSKWFKLTVRLEIFGHTIFEWVFPPKS